MRDPYLYDDSDVLRNRAGIRDVDTLRRAEGDITKVTLAIVYGQVFKKFNTQTLLELHRLIFGDLYDWAGEIRSIQMIKAEEVLGGDTVRYAHPNEIKKQLDDASREIAKLKKAEPPKELLFKIVRLTARLWQIHPFREGNTRTVVAFSILLAEHLGVKLEYVLFEKHAAYVRNSLVWGAQGIYSKFEYLERIYFDAAGLLEKPEEEKAVSTQKDFSMVNGYSVDAYKETPHQYSE